MRQKTEQIVRNYESQIYEKESKANDLQQALDHLKRDLAAAKDTISQQKQALDANNSRSNDLQSQLSLKSNELLQINQHVTKLNKLMSDSSTKLQSYHQETRNLAEQLDSQLAKNGN